MVHMVLGGDPAQGLEWEIRKVHECVIDLIQLEEHQIGHNDSDQVKWPH